MEHLFFFLITEKARDLIIGDLILFRNEEKL